MIEERVITYMMNISDDVKELVNKYIEKYGEYPKGWDFKNESLSEYLDYLRKMILKN